MARCFHCNEPVPPRTSYVLDVHGEVRQFCCPGCRAVAELIDAQGLSKFYDYREAPAPKAPENSDARAHRWSVCDRPQIAARLGRSVGEHSELDFRVDGVSCAACAWLIERGLRAIDGVDTVSVNPITHETLVRFDPERVKISEILATTERYGFTPRVGLGAGTGVHRGAGRDELKRLAVAGLGFAQVMMLSAALYLGAFKGMTTSFANFFVLASMLVATPVVFYAGAPIFRSALADLAQRRVGMDVPVSLAIAIALGASLVNAFRGSGHVYFDSATMFVFFLTLGRFLEARVRHRAASFVTALAELRPLSAFRKRDGALENVGTIELAPGDVVVVAPGEAIPADGELLSTSATLDESLLSGESLGRKREQGEPVLGGSLNIGNGPLELRVTQTGNDGYIDRIGSLLQLALADRPEFLRAADRWASVFVSAVLGITVVVGTVWLQIAPERALEIVLATLVVTCPCALSLAAPAAFAVALGRLARLGLLCRSARVLERLGDVTVWFFDKTGTLTEGSIGIARIDVLRDTPEAECLDIAAALEAGNGHPIAQAFRRATNVAPADSSEYEPGFGVTGTVLGHTYRLGSARHVGRDAIDDGPYVYLTDATGLIARFTLADRLRPHAREAIAMLATDSEIALVSGDAFAPVEDTARALGIASFSALEAPTDKLERLRIRQAAGDVVAAVGDGINDAPLLSQADVSIAMISGSGLAQASADIVFTGRDLRLLARLPVLARRTRAVVQQNLAWAVCYNLAALPLAATGMLAPWMAALGMSLSSLVVVGNALRLNRATEDATEPQRSTVTAMPLAARLER